MAIDVMRGTYVAYEKFGMVGSAKRSKTGCRSFLSNLPARFGSVLADEKSTRENVRFETLTIWSR
jgi:hypothetical protein